MRPSYQYETGRNQNDPCNYYLHQPEDPFLHHLLDCPSTALPITRQCTGRSHQPAHVNTVRVVADADPTSPLRGVCLYLRHET
ncbi:hypothetical protein O3P69_008359 [Scylla paramamosain]|uniref:Uncharacterized protein n=1 Tax=Scylla paramamosain TaxID=85552 RepID=A0AAW0SKD7_SCYPA